MIYYFLSFSLLRHVFLLFFVLFFPLVNYFSILLFTVINYCSNSFSLFFYPTQDAIVKGTALPARPKAFFIPDKNKRMTETGEIIEAEVEVSGKNLKERSKSSGSDSKSFGKKK